MNNMNFLKSIQSPRYVGLQWWCHLQPNIQMCWIGFDFSCVINWAHIWSHSYVSDFGFGFGVGFFGVAFLRKWEHLARVGERGRSTVVFCGLATFCGDLQHICRWKTLI